MPTLATLLITLGVLFLLGFATHELGRRMRLPRVTLLLVLGILIGPSGLGLLSGFEESWSAAITNMALVMVGFLLGEKLTVTALRRWGRFVLWISVAEIVATAAVMLVGLLAIDVRLDVALLLAGIATATDPAATADVVHDAEVDTPFSRTLLGIVAIDDAWGLIVFSVMLAAAQGLTDGGISADVLLAAGRDLGGALLLGICLGVPMAYLTGRVRPGEPALAEALGFVFLCGGVAVWLDVSFLLASMIMGTVVANLATHHDYPFHAIEGIEWPFLILFFVLAGASLDVTAIGQVGLVGIAYLVLRVAGRLLGAFLGGSLTGAAPVVQRWMGLALLPQAGVAMGMALVATQQFPQLRDTIIPVVLGTTVGFELIGPIFARMALSRVGEALEPG
jgi:Kef-type K+ transport system membrane component KefB